MSGDNAGGGGGDGSRFGSTVAHYALQVRHLKIEQIMYVFYSFYD
jgi:hypothetical protein